MKALKSIVGIIVAVFLLVSSALLLCVVAKLLGASQFQQGAIAACVILLLPKLATWLGEGK